MILSMSDNFTTFQLAKSIDAATYNIVELLDETNAFQRDLPNIPCNAGQIHKVFLRDTYYKGEVHAYNEGVGQAFTDVHEKHEGLMMVAAYSQIDANLAEDSGQNVSTIRMNNAKPIIMGMGMGIEEKLIYGSAANSKAKEVNGLAVRRNAKNVYTKLLREGVSGTIAAQADRDKKVDGASKVTSVYVCSAGTSGVHLLHGAGSVSIGISRTDEGRKMVEYAPGKKGPVYIDYFRAQWGLAIEDERALWRIANIPTAGLTEEQAKKVRADLIEALLFCQKNLPPGTQTAVIYANILGEMMIEKAGRDIQTHIEPTQDPWGKPVTMVNGMRMRRTPSILCGKEFSNGGELAGGVNELLEGAAWAA